MTLFIGYVTNFNLGQKGLIFAPELYSLWCLPSSTLDIGAITFQDLPNLSNKLLLMFKCYISPSTFALSVLVNNTYFYVLIATVMAKKVKEQLLVMLVLLLFQVFWS